MTTFNQYIGAVIREARLKKQLSQQQVADHIGVKRSAYSHYESGKNTLPLPTWTKIASYLEIDMDKVAIEALKVSKE